MILIVFGRFVSLASEGDRSNPKGESTERLLVVIGDVVRDEVGANRLLKTEKTAQFPLPHVSTDEYSVVCTFLPNTTRFGTMQVCASQVNRRRVHCKFGLQSHHDGLVDCLPVRPSATPSLSSPKNAQEQISNMTSYLQNLKTQMITKEDPFHVHKTLGVACLASFVWRFSMMGDADMGFALYPSYTLPTLLLHFSLNASSFFFTIPAKRIKTGDRICTCLYN